MKSMKETKLAKVGDLLTITGPHPYDATVAETSLRVPVYDELPGEALEVRDLRRSKTKAAKAEGWQILAGPYRIEPGAYEGLRDRIQEVEATLERWALLSLLWDLTGQPFRASGSKRRAARIAVVRDGSGISVYRDAKECLTSEVMRELRRHEEPDVVGQWADLRANSGPVRRHVA